LMYFPAINSSGSFSPATVNVFDARWLGEKN
jgi:hypothetical protein